MESKQGPLISIICAVRNDARFIRETLDTVVSQTYPELELVIMDGASTDGTIDIIKEYAGKHKNIIWRSESDQGQWDALDKALALSTGKHISLLCGQDGYLDNDWFGRCAEVLEDRPEIALVWGIPFNMSEEGKLVGPHYAYAGFLKDGRYGSQTKPMSTIAAKINWGHPDSFQRLQQMAGKLTWSRAKMVLKSFKKREIPQEEDWFRYWLGTGRAFPEGNMVMCREVFLANTVRFPEEKMTNAALLDFCFNFNAKGYLAYGLPVAASFGRSHAEGQALREYDAELTGKYRTRVAEFKKDVERRKTFQFVDPNGRVIPKKVISV